MFQSVRIVLMKTSHPGNIGAVARAMKNMGFFDLVLVNPKIFPSDVSFQRASGASDILDKARVVDSLDEALIGCHVVIGASARNRKITWPVMNPRDCAEKIGSFTCDRQSKAEANSVALIFGQENNGLSNEELQRCNYHVHIPSNPDFGSLNLAMAVQVILYELRMYVLLNDKLASQVDSFQVAPILNPLDKGWDEPPAEVGDVDRFLVHLEQTMVETEFHDPENPRQLMRRMRRLFQRTQMDKMEVNILRGFLTSVLDHIKKRKSTD